MDHYSDKSTAGGAYKRDKFYFELDPFVIDSLDGFDPDGKQLYIDPDECIDCGLCEPECPIEAIYAEDEVPANQIEFIEINDMPIYLSDIRFN